MGRYNRGFGERGFVEDRETGGEHERDLFGVPFKDADFKKYNRYVKEHASSNGHMYHGPAIDAIRKFYPEGLELSPEKDFARDLRIDVIDKLKVHPDWMDDVKFYSALGTNVDIFHGVDAWVEITSPFGHPIVITLDATINTQKLEYGYKAQVMVGKIPDSEDEKYLELVSYYADQIVTILKNRVGARYLQQPKEKKGDIKKDVRLAS